MSSDEGPARPEARSPVAVIGLGNPLMSDEGVGVRVVAELREAGPPFPGVDVLDLGTSGMHVLHELEGRTKVVFVDCAEMGEAPGALRRFTPEEVVSRKVRTRLSLHEGDLLHTLALARELGACPRDVVILGIQPETVAPGERLSPPLAARLGEYGKAVCTEVAR